MVSQEVVEKARLSMKIRYDTDCHVKKGTRPLQIWRGPKSYTRWDRKTGWLWACWICRIECNPPCGSQAVAYSAAIKHLMVDHLGEE